MGLNGHIILFNVVVSLFCACFLPLCHVKMYHCLKEHFLNMRRPVYVPGNAEAFLL